MSIGFDREITHREYEMIDNKPDQAEENFYVRTLIKDVSDLSNREKSHIWLGLQFNSTRKI